MFTTRGVLKRKAEAGRADRCTYIEQLIAEFQGAVDEGAKLQVLANLVNLAFDPINSHWMRSLNVIDLFTDCLSESNVTMVEFGCAGLANLMIDTQNHDSLDSDSFELIFQCLGSSQEGVCLHAATTVLLLVLQSSPGRTCPVVMDPAVRNKVMSKMRVLASSPSKRVSNIARVFLASAP